MEQSEKTELVTQQITDLMQKLDQDDSINAVESWLVYTMSNLPTPEIVGMLTYFTLYQVIGIKKEEDPFQSVFGSCVMETSECLLVVLSNRLSEDQETAQQELENIVSKFVEKYTTPEKESDNETDQSETG